MLNWARRTPWGWGWLRWHCPPDTGFEIRALAVWGRVRYLSVTEAPHNTDFHTWMGKKHSCFFETAETGNRTPNSGVKGSGANHYPRAPAHAPLSVLISSTTQAPLTIRYLQTGESLTSKCIFDEVWYSTLNGSQFVTWRDQPMTTVILLLFTLECRIVWVYSLLSEPRPGAVFIAACLESRRSRVRTPLWHSSFKETECFFPLTRKDWIFWGASVTDR